MTNASDKKHELILIEYNNLWTAKFNLVAERRRVETGVVLGTAAVYSWIFTRSNDVDPNFFNYSLAIPLVVSILGALRWLAIQLQILKIVQYSLKIERRVLGRYGGWEAYIAKVRNHKRLFGWSESLAEVALWSILVFLSLGILIIFWKAEFGSPYSKEAYLSTVKWLSGTALSF